MKRLAAPRRAAIEHPWSLRVRIANPDAPARTPDVDSAVAEMLVRRRVADLGYLLAETHGSGSRRAELTRLQQDLKDATAHNDAVADDPVVQQFRQQLHLLLDH